MGKNANGEGSITYDKKRRRHRVRITFDTPEGPRRKHLGWFKTRDEAHAALVEALSKNGRRRLTVDAGKVSVADYLRDWLQNTARVNVSNDVFAFYGHEVREYLIPFLGSARLADLRWLHVRAAKQ